MSDGLSIYGKRKLGSIYKRFADNTSFESVEDFYTYAMNNNFKDYMDVKLDVISSGLRESNITFVYTKTHSRSDRLGLMKGENLSYGEKVNLIKELFAYLSDLEQDYMGIIYSLNMLEDSDYSIDTRKLRAYLENGQSNLTSILEEVKQVGSEVCSDGVQCEFVFH